MEEYGSDYYIEKKIKEGALFKVGKGIYSEKKNVVRVGLNSPFRGGKNSPNSGGIKKPMYPLLIDDVALASFF